MNVLISPLGRSPGAVSGVYFALAAQREIKIDKVVVVATSHKDVIRSSKTYLEPMFDYLGVGYEAYHLPEQELRGERRSVAPYAAMIGWAIQDAEQNGHVAHVSVTAGRSGMGALAAMASQLYGPEAIWHLWVDPDIEKQGSDHDRLPLLPGDMVRCLFLNPTSDNADRFDLVQLPFLNLKPLQKYLYEYRHTQQLPENHPELQAFLQQIGIKNLFSIFPSKMTFESAEQVLSLAEEYKKQTDGLKRDRIIVDLVTLLQTSGIVDRDDKSRVLTILRNNGSIDDLLKAVCKDNKKFWKWAREHKDEILVTMAVSDSVVNILAFLISAYVAFS